MIIKFNIHENDYGDLIDLFFDNFSSNLILDTDIIDGGTYDSKYNEEYMAFHKANKKIRELLNPNINFETPNKENQMFLTEQIKKSFQEFLVSKKLYKLDISYLLEKLEISFPLTFEDKIENGEVWYWFQCSGKFINQ